VSPLERLVDLFASQYRWGLHPLKFVAALAAPSVIVCLADRRIRRIAANLARDDDDSPQLPRLRR
jgi:hypothetical protein